jgi:membrane protein DedA with SNARE-associated domain
MFNLSGIVGTVVDRVGVAGIGVGVFLNGLGVPGVSEVLLPLGGVAIKQGKLNLTEVFVVAMICQLVGVSLAYLIARFGGIALIERYGKYVFISSRELAATHRAFEKYGERLVMVGAFIPGIQGFIGYAAGIAEMNYVRFVLWVFVGKLVWIGGLLYLGSVLSKHINLIDQVLNKLGIAVLAALIILAIWYVKRHRRAAKSNNDVGGPEEKLIED